MTFDEVLAQVLEILQRQGRVSYGALKRHFDLDDSYLDDLKTELIDAQRLAADEGAVSWCGVVPRAHRPRPFQPHRHSRSYRRSRGPSSREGWFPQRPNAASSRSWSATWWTPQGSPASLTQKSSWR
jgi:hypothetical protein